jgi:BirA family transcriptional regulator, biotin operon repressor / biotin---[acetyl-CoA-carboxylase] ligase
LRHASIFRFAKLPHYHALLSEPFSFASARIHQAEVGSTNSFAKELLHTGVPADRTLITADSQTAGRGQRDRQWLSQAGANITCSYILRPNFLSTQRQFALGAALALAVRDTVAELLPSVEEPVRIKWPNDILIGRQKVAGILIENSIRGASLDTVIVGIGLNVNQQDFPSGINATSLSFYSEQKMNVETALHTLDRHLGLRYEQVRGLRFSEIADSYNQLLFGLGDPIMLVINGVQEQVEVLGAEESGLLKLRHADGSVTLHAHHELDWACALKAH